MKRNYHLIVIYLSVTYRRDIYIICSPFFFLECHTWKDLSMNPFVCSWEGVQEFLIGLLGIPHWADILYQRYGKHVSVLDTRDISLLIVKTSTIYTLFNFYQELPILPYFLMILSRYFYYCMKIIRSRIHASETCQIIE